MPQWRFILFALVATCLAKPADPEDYSYNEYPISITAGMVFGILVPLAAVYFLTKEPKPQEKDGEKDRSPVLSFDYYTYYLTLGWVGPSLSIISCVAYSLFYHFDSVTSTHCKVPNPLPSAAVGNKIPERFFFRFGILIHSSQRILDAFLIYAWFEKKLPKTHFFTFLNRVMCWFHIAENICLWGLTYIGSTEYYMYHEKSFVFWVIFQGLKCILHLYIFPFAVPNPEDFHAQRKWTFAINVLSIVMGGFLFALHNTVCIPYVYAGYGFVEYVAVGTNIYFNCEMALMVGDGKRLILSFDVDRPPKKEIEKKA